MPSGGIIEQRYPIGARFPYIPRTYVFPPTYVFGGGLLSVPFLQKIFVLAFESLCGRPLDSTCSHCLVDIVTEGASGLVVQQSACRWFETRFLLYEYRSRRL